MNLSGPFIMRPVMTTLVMAAFVIFGLIAFCTLPINDLPAVDFPTINVSASVPGANADTMASAVATPLEKQFSLIAGLDNMNSSSNQGSTNVTLQFNLNRNIEGAAQDVQSAIIAARQFLPASMPTPPTLRKVNPSDAPIMFVALSSPTLPLYTVDEYAENVLATRMSMVSGVAQVQVYGSQIYSPHVQVDPRKLASYGIGIDQVATAVKNANVNLPCGTLYGPNKCWNVMANGQLFNAAAFRPVIVAYKNGSPVRLDDIGDVIDSVQTDKVATWFNNKRAIILAVQRQPNTNTIAIVDGIMQLMPNFRAILPGSVNLDIMFDRSQGIRRSVTEVERTLLITIGLVIMVIFLFLGNVSTTVIASLALPISLLGTFAAMKFFGFTLNNISLMGLTLCVGFVVDDAIVVLENISRHMEMGEPPLMAAVHGSKEICFTILSMTLSLIAVFIPILLMGGIVGRLFFEFGVTISVAILISGFVSITLTPMLCSRFLRPHGDRKRNPIHALSESVFSKVQDQYAHTLQFALRHKIGVVVLFWLMVGATGFVMYVVPKGFMPSEDSGMIMATTQAAEGVSFDEMVDHQKKVAAVVTNNPNVLNFMSSVGSGGGNSSVNQGRMFIILKPKSQRSESLDNIIQDLRKGTANIPGIKLFMQNRPTINIGGMQTNATFQFSLSGPNLSDLYGAEKDLENKMRAMPDLQDVNSDLQIKNLQLSVEIDRDKCSQLGISMEQVQDALNSAYSARQISVIYTPTNQYWVILEVQPQYYRDPSMMSWFFVRSANGTLIPLFTLAKVDRTAGPLQINHIGQFPSTTLSFNLKPGMPLSDAVAQVKELTKTGLPEDVQASFQGTAKAFESSTKDLPVLLLVSVMVIYIVLGILYESYIHPVTILSGLPSAGLGAMIILMLFHLDLNIYSFLGLILLIGIVKKNAIMMIDFALEKQRHENASAEESIYEACLTRFRPIMMTTMAALLGSLPIAIGIGEGSESRQPLGLTIVGGLLVSQIVTLYITPVFYIYLDKLKDLVPIKKKAQLIAEEGAV